MMSKKQCGGDLVAQSCLTLATPWTVDPQAPLSTGFSRPECWSEVPSWEISKKNKQNKEGVCGNNI